MPMLRAGVSLCGRRGRGGASCQHHLDSDLPHQPRYLYPPPTCSPTLSGPPSEHLGDTSAVDDRGAAGPALGRRARPGGSGRRKAGSSSSCSSRLRFQYPDVFGRRRARGGSTTTARRRATIAASARINFRRRTAQAQRRDDVTSGGDTTAAARPEVVSSHCASCNVVYNIR